MGVIELIGILLRALLANRAALAMENLALRQRQYTGFILLGRFSCIETH